LTSDTVSGETTKENNNDAKTKPTTNLGKRSQISFSVGLSRLVSSSTDFAYVQ
jgi:NaMN:DMB phosphoribosyltransferase